MPWFIAIALVVWAVFGSPKKDAAEWFWGDDAAPWENVQGFFYPNKNNLSVHQEASFETVDDCRDWARQKGNLIYNATGSNSYDYECGVGYLENFGELKVYRRTVH